MQVGEMLGQKYIMFQSSPSPKTGRYVFQQEFKDDNTYQFQSSPSPKTGRYRNSFSWARVIPTYMFQSSPSPKTGRYSSWRDYLQASHNVPILTQSEDWALLSMTLAGCPSAAAVPILTQSEDWALLCVSNAH